MLAIIAATSGAFWGYDGWNNITFIAGEIKDPQRNMPPQSAHGTLSHNTDLRLNHACLCLHDAH